MSTEKYTPGPWTTYLNTMDDVIIRKMNAAGYEVCVIAKGAKYKDARLIAAAPDLLDALYMVLDDPDALDGRPRTYECVREAIAKATGETQ